MSRQRFLYSVLTALIVTAAIMAVLSFRPVVDLKNYVIEKTPPPKTKLLYFKSLLYLLNERDLTTVANVQKAKDLGANVAVMALDAKTAGNKISLTESPFQKAQAAKLINEAHKNGLQAELRVLSNTESGTPTNPDEFLKNSLPFVKEISQFAELHKVYQLTLLGEADNEWTLGSNEKALDNYLQTILEESRKYYNGRIGIGLCCTFTKPRVIKGYDYLIVSIYPGPFGKTERYLKEFEEKIKAARKLADQNGVGEVMVGEFGFVVKEEADQFPWAKDFTMVLDEEQQADLYNEIFSRTNTSVDGYTIFYGFPLMSVYHKKAEGVVKEWFEKL